MTNTIDRNMLDGKIGFALDWLHYTNGIGTKPETENGPNYGQHFPTHLIFYARLNAR